MLKPGVLYVSVVSGRSNRQEREFTEYPVQIGRDIDLMQCDDSSAIIFNPQEETSVSRHHASIIQNQKLNQLFLVDIGSSNGTTLNGNRVAKNAPMAISDGDEIQFGGPKGPLIQLKFKPVITVPEHKEAPPDSMFACDHCRHPNSTTEKYCINCGQPIRLSGPIIINSSKIQIIKESLLIKKIGKFISTFTILTIRHSKFSFKIAVIILIIGIIISAYFIHQLFKNSIL